MVTTVELRPNGARIAGRCCQEAIRLGDTFSLVRRFKPTETLEELEEPGTVESERGVDLKVISIFTYGRNLAELDHGMTGLIEFEGSGAEMLSDGELLVGM